MSRSPISWIEHLSEPPSTRESTFYSRRWLGRSRLSGVAAALLRRLSCAGPAVSIRAASLTAGLILLLLPLFSCDSSFSPTAPGDGAIAFETVAQAEVGGVLGEPRYEVVRDQRTWATVWADLQPQLAEAPPAVNFDWDMVAVAAMATEPCAARVEILEVVDQGIEVAVGAVDTRPTRAASASNRSGPFTPSPSPAAGAPANCARARAEIPSPRHLGAEPREARGRPASGLSVTRL